MRRFKSVLIVLLIVSVAGLIFWLNSDPAEEATGSGLERGAPLGGGAVMFVRTEVVVPQPFERSVRLHGTLLPREGIEVRSEVSGVIEEVRFDEGTLVEAGTVLMRLDDRELRAELRAIQAELDLAKRNEERLHDLRERGATSQRDYDEARSQLNVLQAQAELLQTRISKRAVQAPFNGVVGLRRVSPGEYITPQDVVAVLNDISELKVDFPVPERYQGELRPGMVLRLNVGALEAPQMGVIQAIEPQVDPQTRTLLARAVVQNEGSRLLPGNFATIDLVFLKDEDALLVPSTALVPGMSETRVFVIENDVAHERVVRTGARLEGYVEVVVGLQSGEEIVVRGAEGLRPGQAIRRQAAGGTPEP